MSAESWPELAFFFVLLAISTPLLGSYMAKIYGGADVSRLSLEPSVSSVTWNTRAPVALVAARE
jgi:K+-transporting ATPase A subunit